MSSPLEIVDALIAALESLRSDVEDIQILPYPMANPTPPTIDVYPGEPFQNGTGFDRNGVDHDLFWTVRARVTTADSDAGWRLLYRLVDPEQGIGALLVADQTLGGVVDSVAIGEDGAPGVSGFREYIDDSAVNGRLLGAELRVRVLT